MKKNYVTPAMRVVAFINDTMICASGVEGTSGFSKRITGETTDEALSRRHSVWDDEEDNDF